MAPLNTFDHSVLLYTSEQELLNSLIKYFTVGWAAEERCIIIATPEHRHILEQQLSDAGFDLRLMETLGKYIALDAANTMSYFMENGMPNAESFNRVIGSMIPYIPKRPIRAFGEMVALLWEQGNEDGAIALEELWNGLGQIRNFSLLCAYPASVLEAHPKAAEVEQVHLEVHTEVMA
jgi:hypothetical protein